MPTERPHTKRIMDWFKGQPDGHAVKVFGGGMAGSGQPDISAAIAGRCVQLEVKVPGKEARKNQAYHLRKWRGAGCIAGVVHTLDDVLGLLAEHGIVRER